MPAPTHPARLELPGLRRIRAIQQNILNSVLVPADDLRISDRRRGIISAVMSGELYVEPCGPRGAAIGRPEDPGER